MIPTLGPFMNKLLILALANVLSFVCFGSDPLDILLSGEDVIPGEIEGE
jgi:hypothetical protein